MQVSCVIQMVLTTISVVTDVLQSRIVLTI